MFLVHEMIYDKCLSSKETDPIRLYNQIVRLESFPMHGPFHHFLIPAVLLTCRHNLLNPTESLKDNLDVAYKRAEIVPGGFCGYFGACGAGIGVGIFVSIITNSNPLAEEEWRNTILASTKCQEKIAIHGGPRCCKRNSYLSFIEGMKFSKEVLGIDFNSKSNLVCFKFKENEQCRKSLCPFYPR